MTRLEALVGLNLVSDIGSVRLKKLLEFFDKPENILKAPLEKLIRVAGIGPKISESIRSINKEDIEKEFRLAKKYNLKLLTWEDQNYPENLKQIFDPPILLYIKGEFKAEDKFSLAVVGSRRASFYGLTCAEKFSGSLVNYGFTIVSGMARGIDTAAHKGALKQNGRTLAVMGSGFNRIYPAENKALAEEIARNGAVISEFPINTEPLKQNFPRRNRVISGLALGVLIVEAARNSGALITADSALEQGRDVFCLPGKIDSQTSFGTHALIKQGAKLVSCVEDITEEFALAASLPSAKIPLVKDKPAPLENNIEAKLDNAEKELFGMISGEPIAIDEITEKMNMTVSGITDLLLKMEIKKLIRQLPGKQYIRSEHGR